MGERGLIESVHDFIMELLDELEGIKFASLFGIIACIIVITVSFRELQRYGLKLLQINVLDFTLAIVSLSSAVIILFTLLSLYRVYSKWRERFRRLIEIEEKLLSSK